MFRPVRVAVGSSISSPVFPQLNCPWCAENAVILPQTDGKLTISKMQGLFSGGFDRQFLEIDFPSQPSGPMQLVLCGQKKLGACACLPDSAINAFLSTQHHATLFARDHMRNFCDYNAVVYFPFQVNAVHCIAVISLDISGKLSIRKIPIGFGTTSQEIMDGDHFVAFVKPVKT